MRERLIELLKQADDKTVREIQIRRLETTERVAYGMIADYLLNNGVVVLQDKDDIAELMKTETPFKRRLAEMEKE